MILPRFLLTIALSVLLLAPAAGLRATSSYDYAPNEYVTVTDGVSPNGVYAIAAHGGDEKAGDYSFHLYLMDAKTGRKIGPLTEIKEYLDTAASAFFAKWSADSGRVTINWRAERHFGGRTITYRLANRRAYCISGPKPSSN